MSHSDEPSDSSKPVVKDKNPHNYRKVGYSMIVISVSLVAIGLLVWAIGDNYHFSSDIMANQEIDAMTPKHGFSILYYDTAQPVGAKMKLLDSASTIDDAHQKQMQYAKQEPSINGMVMIFNETYSSNQKLVADTVSAIGQAQAAKAQADKIQAEQASAAQAANTASANQTKPVTPAPTNHTAPTTTPPSTNQTSVVANPSGANVGLNDTVSANVSNVTSTNNTSHNKSITLSESVGIQTK